MNRAAQPDWFRRTRARRGRAALALLGLACARALAADGREVVIDFEQAQVGKPLPAWTEQGVTFALAGPLAHSQAAGRVMFFPYLPGERKGILNAMAQEQEIPLEAKFPAPVARVTCVLWASTGCPAKLQAFDAAGKLVDEAAVPTAPGRQTPADPVPQFTLTVKGPAIASVQLSGPRTGEFLAADEVRFVLAEPGSSAGAR